MAHFTQENMKAASGDELNIIDWYKQDIPVVFEVTWECHFY